MELWIRSQDKELLLKPICFEIDEEGKNKFLIITKIAQNYNDICVGLYKTKERALEVLDEIQSILMPKIMAYNPLVESKEDYQNHNMKTELVGYATEYDVFALPTYVYEMPKE